MEQMSDQLGNWLAIMATHFENLILFSVLTLGREMEDPIVNVCMCVCVCVCDNMYC